MSEEKKRKTQTIIKTFNSRTAESQKRNMDKDGDIEDGFMFFSK